MVVRGSSGGGKTEPFIALARVQTGYGMFCINTETAKKYKYIKILSQQDYVNIFGDTVEKVYITTTDCHVRGYSGDSWHNVSTTPVLISSFTLVDGDAMLVANNNSISNWGGFAYMLYND